jgi:hypothetical protein
LTLSLSLQAQTGVVPDNGGNGTDGPFLPFISLTLDTDVQSVYNFTTFNIPAGMTVTVIGANPITIRAQGVVTIDGVLDVSGQAGGNSTNGVLGGLGGAGGPGGGRGGDGGCEPANPGLASGTAGSGRSGGQPGTDLGPVPGTFTDPVGGGGGGGNTTPGATGANPNAGGGASLSGVGGGVVFPARAGSGGGGGGCDIDAVPPLTAGNDGGAGGGGGGGRLQLYSNDSILIGATGVIRANGGNGGTNSGNGGAGGGGSGGTIELAAPLISNDGQLRAIGGAAGPATQGNCGCSAGGTGGLGEIVIAGPLAGVGTAIPAASVFDLGLMLTDSTPIASLQVLGAPGDAYVLGLSGSLGSPVALGGGFFLDLNTADVLFQLTFPVNLISNHVSGLFGAVPGMATIDLTGLPTDAQALAFAQAVTFTSIVTGSSNVVPIIIRL